ncbi:MAG: hypothetical protein ACREBI_10335 [Nitrosotalea sp.]
MCCENEYNALVKSTEKLYEIYYQQENADFAFSIALVSAQNHMIASGLVRLVTASASEIVNVLEDNAEKGFFELHDAAENKVQTDAVAMAAEESYRDTCHRYDECIKRQTV